MGVTVGVAAVGEEAVTAAAAAGAAAAKAVGAEGVAICVEIVRGNRSYSIWGGSRV